MKKLTKNEEELRRKDPKKYRKLMRQRKKSSAFKAKQSEARKGKQIKEVTTKTPRSTQSKAAALAAISMIPGVGRLASAIKALGAGERLTQSLQNRVNRFLDKNKLPKPKGTAVAKRPGTSVAVKSKPKPKLPKSGATGKAVAATLGIAGSSTPVKKPKAAPPAPKRKPPAPKRKPPVPKTKPNKPISYRASDDPDEPDYNLFPKTKPKKDEAISLGEYFKGAIGLRGKEGLEGKKRLVKTPFGNMTVDTSPEAFEALEPEEYKAGGRVKRNVGGKVRGVGQAVKGFGKATYSNKLI